MFLPAPSLGRPQNPAKYTNVGTMSPASISTAAADLYLVNGNTDVGQQAEAIRKFVAGGGGVLMANLAWTWT